MKKTTLIIATVAVIILLVFIGRAYLSVADFSIENPSWNGLSDLSGVNLQPLYNTADLSGVSPTDTTLLIISPTRNYTPAESASVESFMASGGKVVVMDDFGKADSLLDDISSPITIYPVPLCDYEDYYINHTFPVIQNFNPSPEMANVTDIILNYPASLNVSGSAYVLAQTSSYGWLDFNDDGIYNGEEPMGTYAVVAKANYGDGQLLVISDPDILINSMLGLGSNNVFMNNILKGNVLLDVSHGRGLTPMGVVYFELKDNVTVQILIILLLISGGYAFLHRHNVYNYIKRHVTRRPGTK